MTEITIPFNKPYLVGTELELVAEAFRSGALAGDGRFTRRCQEWLERATGTPKSLLTHSCTAALEMAALLAALQPGDEVIMPSFTFVSSANAFVLRGAVPVFVDIRPDTLNLDERLIEMAITPRTRAIVPVHYAGVSCAMAPILEIARRHGLLVIEDAAQGLMSSYRGRPLGTLGDFGALSFHETKNVISGEGGALLIGAGSESAQRAEIIREKGTNRSQFFRGQVDKYSWVDVGSSYPPSELIAAFLYAQLQQAEQITARRLALWQSYHAALADAESAGQLRRPIIPDDCEHNAHTYYLLLADLPARTRFIARMRNAGIACVFHYVPLHSAPAGRKHGRCHGDLRNTDTLSERLVRLPLWIGLEPQQERVIEAVLQSLDAG